MTKWEKITYENRRAVVNFLKENNISASELSKIAKELCACGTCYFFVQHYDKDGNGLDWGHCCKGNIQHSKKQSTAACGFWRDDMEDYTENGGVVTVSTNDLRRLSIEDS